MAEANENPLLPLDASDMVLPAARAKGLCPVGTALAFRHLPASYVDGVVYAALPACPARGRLGLALQVGDAPPMRVALSLAEADWLAGVLGRYVAEAAGVQSPASAGMPSAPRSVPQEGV